MRTDTGALGFIKIARKSKYIYIKPVVPMEEQLAGLMKSLTDETAHDGELLLQVRHLNFAGNTNPYNEKGMAYIRLSLYAKSGEGYFKLNQLDTLIAIKASGMAEKLVGSAGKAVANFIAASVRMTVTDSTRYSVADLDNFERLEKKRLRLYTTLDYKDGIYLSYNSFKQQVPDRQGIISMNDKLVREVWVNDAGGAVRLKESEIYAVVKDGIPYVTTEYGFFQLRRKKNDFYFIGKVKISADPMTVALTGAFFGWAAALAQSFDKATAYEIKLDYFNGSFVRVRDLLTKPE
jgi:hypothetical protein